MQRDKLIIKVTKQLHNGMWNIIIQGISSGFKVIPIDEDNIKITCKYDADRFDPYIEVRQ